MRENGTIAGQPTVNGGFIDPEDGPPQVRYSGKAVKKGPTPREGDPVCFERIFKGATTAAAVSFGACGTDLESNQTAIEAFSPPLLSRHLEMAFQSSLEQVPNAVLSADGLDEVKRMSADRAARILRPLRAGETLPDEVKSARFLLAETAMSLMATEAALASKGTVTAEALRRVLRGQRPPLRRKPKS